MRKIISLIMATLLTVSVGLASACQQEAPKSLIGAQLNDKGELILTYSDNTTQNLGVVKGEDGKDGENGLNGKDGVDGTNGNDGEDGKDGVDLTACEHSYGNWELQLSPTCTSIGYNTRTCSLCGDLEYYFYKALGHAYRNPIDIINTYEQHLVRKTCFYCGDIQLEEVAITKHVFEGEWETNEYPCATVKQRPCLYCDTKQTEIIETIDFSAHTFDENTLCTTCGYQEFIQSEEYITIQKEAIGNGWGYPYDLYTWISADGSYGLQIMSNPNNTFISGHIGTPVNVILPSKIHGISITYIGDQYGMGFTALPFKNCETLESIYIRKNMKIHARTLSQHSFIGCSNLKYVYLEEGAGCFTYYNNEIFPYAEIIYL